MNTLQVFKNPEFGSIRTVEIGGEPWLVGKDVAVALGYSNPSKAVAIHVDKEDKSFEMMPVSDAQNGNLVKTALINESGLYSLILSSKLPSAKKFKRWVTSEVLPSIRKTGGYMVPAAEDAPASKKDVADLTAAVQLMAEQMAALVAQKTAAPVPALPSALPGSAEAELPGFGPAARKKWLRTANEKLDLLSTKLSLPHNVILSKIYRQMEEKGGANLEEEKLRCAVTQNLPGCSILAAISYNEWLREGFQKIVDFNLAPENRGW